jgi:hypothetical protein
MLEWFTVILDGDGVPSSPDEQEHAAADAQIRPRL